MIQMSPPVQEYILEENNSQDFDFTKLGVTFEFNELIQIEAAKEEYQQLKKRIELLNQDNSKAYLRIPYNSIKQDGFTVQSIAKIEENIIISAYKKNDYSRLYIYDIKTAELEGKIILDNKAHVGGISFDYDRNILYVTGNKGEINSYDYNVIKRLAKEKDYTINLSDNIEPLIEEQLEIKINNNIYIKNIDSDLEASTICFYDNKLYIATFNPIGKGFLYSYKVDYDANSKSINIKDEHTKKYDVCPRVQGIAITRINDIEYLICSQSISLSNSSISVYQILDEEIKYIGKTYLTDHGLEGITIDDNNYLVGVFENNNIPIMVKKVDDLFKEISASFLDIIPGNEIESFIEGVGYKLFR